MDLARFILSALVLIILSCNPSSEEGPEIVFQFDIDTPMISGITAMYQDELIYWTRDASGKSYLQAYSVTQGETSWQAEVESSEAFAQEMQIYDDYLIVDGRQHGIYVYDLDRLEWLHTIDFASTDIIWSHGLPKYEDGMLYGLYYMRGLGSVAAAVDLQSGELQALFKLDAGADLVKEFEMHHDAVSGEVMFNYVEVNYDPSPDNSSYLLKSSSSAGTIILDTFRHTTLGIATYDDYLLCLSGDDKELGVYDLQSGQSIGVVDYDCLPNGASNIYVVDDRIFIHGAGLAEITIEDKTPLWCRTYPSGGTRELSVVLVNEKLVFPTYSTISVVLDAQTGIPEQSNIDLEYPARMHYYEPDDVLIIPSDDLIIGARW